MKISYILLILSLLASRSDYRQGNGTLPDISHTEKNFTNPLQTGADPWVYQKDGFYYYTQTVGSRIDLWKTAAMSELASAQRTTIFTPLPTGPNAKNIWAPEIHFLNSKWYAYYTAGSGPDSTQRTWVLENSNPDPTTGTWIDKGKIASLQHDWWAIDGTILELNSKLYFLWSGRPVASFQTQNIYISQMTNPWTLEGPMVRLTTPELSWERKGGPVNEGPEILKNSSEQVFMIYSASGCWTDDYALGMLSLRPGGDPMNASDWTKSQQPVMTKSPAGNAFAPGHNTFFTSPDGREHWILYHANTTSGAGCGNKRNVRMQPFTFRADGSPQFDEPVAAGQSLPVPSGEAK